MTLGPTTPIRRRFVAVRAKLTAKDYKYAKPGIESPPCAGREVSVKTPFGNRLTFVSAI